MMNSRRISAEQIDLLYAFTRKHFVEYFDLQTELVDHLANAIEEKWQADPAITFEAALDIEFKKFGVFGFTEIVEQRQLALSKRYYKLVWQYSKAFFKLPKILLTISIFVGSNMLFKIDPDFYNISMIIVLVLSFIKTFQLFSSYKKQAKKSGKKWLFEAIIFRGEGLIFVSTFPIHFSSLTSNHQDSAWFVYWASFWFTAFVIYNYLVLYVIPSKALVHLKETYPEYDMAKFC